MTDEPSRFWRLWLRVSWRGRMVDPRRRTAGLVVYGTSEEDAKLTDKGRETLESTTERGGS